jgi:ABC-2 type transport system permease protein
MAGLVLLVGALTTAGTVVLSLPFGLLEGISALDLTAAGAAATLFALLHASIAFFVGCAVGGRARSIAVAATVAVGGYVVFGLVSSGIIRAARFVIPWHWYMGRNIVARGPGPDALLLPLALSLLLAAAGIRLFGGRDLR